MNFGYRRLQAGSRGRLFERTLEIFPASLSWGLLVSLPALCLFAPTAGVILVILLDLYWLLRLVYFTIFLILSYGLLEVERSAPWRNRLEDLTNLESSISKSQGRLSKIRSNWKTFYSEWRHLEILKRLRKKSVCFPHPDEIYHLVIIPFFQEDLEVLEASVKALANVNYPKERIVVILGVEERAGEEALNRAETLKRKYGHHFLHFQLSLHPAGIPGETAVKSANATHAARWAKEFFDSRHIPLERILVSCFDSDTVVGPEYFGCLTYNFLIHPKRTQTSFQPIPVYHNNLWEAPSFARVLETGSSFLQLIEVTDPEHLVTFSSHSMSFQALVEIGYWPVDLVSDDSAIFWKAFLAFDGDYGVEPLYVTLSMDVAIGRNLWETCQSIYRQKRRWAWGVENFPILVRGLLSNPRIPLWLKVKRAFRLLEMNISWATWTPLMLLLSWAPAFVASREFTSSVAHFNAPRVAAVICGLAIASLGTSIVLSFLLLPKRPRKVRFFENLVFALQWLFVPLIATVFGAIPALDAQTRLALGRYMEFLVAPKGGRRRKLGSGQA